MISTYNDMISRITDPENNSPEQLESAIGDVALRLTTLTNTYIATSQTVEDECSSYTDTYDEQHNPNCVHTTGKGALYKPHYLLSIP
jgi:hypothetical protein